jgi:CRP/FNR family cyclic AMP-dependent transcriptional regulator
LISDIEIEPSHFKRLWGYCADILSLGAGRAPANYTAKLEESADDTDMYFILDGVFEVFVRGKRVGQRAAGTQVGEMAAAQPGQRRSASVIALGDAVVPKLQEKDLVLIGEKFPDIWRQIAWELARRLLERNRFIAA